MRRKKLLFAPLILVTFAVFIAVGGEIVRLLWNWLMPALFGLPPVTFWQALGLLALCRILFGGFGAHRTVRGSVGRRVAERWAAMTPEERERFRDGMRARCGFRPPGTTS